MLRRLPFADRLCSVTSVGCFYICIPWSFNTLSYRVVSPRALREEQPPRHAPHTPHLRGQLGLRCWAKVCKYKYNLTASVIGMVQSQSYGPTTCLTLSHTNPRHITSELPGYHVNSWSGNKKVPGARCHTLNLGRFLSPLRPLPHAPTCRECDLPPWSNT